MTILRVSGFGGIIPRLGARLLPDNNAQFALNAQLFSGELRSWQQPQLLATFSAHPNLADVFHYRHPGDPTLANFYIPFDRRTDVVKAPIQNDAFNRLYWTDGVKFTITTMADVEAGTPGQPVGVPAPVFGTTPAVAVAGGLPANAVTRVYSFILVSKYGEEGSPVDNSTVTVSGNSDGTWTVTNINTLAAVANPNIIALRMYRTITSTASSTVTFREVVQWTIGAIPASYSDIMSETTLAVQPALESLGWDPPPVDLQGLVAGPSGMMSAFKGRTVFFSVPYFPHAWPDSYQLAIPEDIVSIGWVGTMLVIGTTGCPSVMSGSSPTAMTIQNFTEVMPCLSRDGFVTTSMAVFYPSSDGLITISADGASNTTNTFAARNDWLSLFTPAALSGAVYQSRYFGFYSSQLGFNVGFDDATTGLANLQYDGVTRLKNSAVDGSAHMIVGNKLYQWDATTDNPLLYVWRSKPFMVPKPVNMGILQIRADFPIQVDNGLGAPPVVVPPPIVIDPHGHDINDEDINASTINGPGIQQQSQASDTIGIKVYGDGVLRFVGAVTSEEPVNLPSGYKAVKWKVELSGTLSIFSVVLGGNRSELEQVP
jgi:hypothetical protein